MTTRTGDGRSGIRFSVERQVAPHVEPAWAEAVLLELRIRGVAGRRIGEVLAEVDTHCVDSGQDARTMFGDPVTYARSLELPVEDDLTARDMLPEVAPVSVQVLGMLATIWGLGAWVGGEPLDVTVGLLVTLGVIGAADVALLWLRGRPLRMLMRRPALVVGGMIVMIAATAVVLLLLDRVVARIPAAPVTLVGLALVAAGQVVILRRGPGRGDDPVVPPVGDPPSDGRATRLLLGATTTWSIPLWTVVLGAVTWWLATAA